MKPRLVRYTKTMAMPKKCSPMLATLVDKPFDDKDWVYEVKWDGFRLLARIERGRAKLFSRNGIDVTAKYPSIARALARIRKDCILDGELVALDTKGRSRFQLLQKYTERKAPLQYVVFDLLYLGGKDIRKRPLLERKTLLKSVLPQNRLLRYSGHIATKGIAYFNAAKKKGLEGVIAKRAQGLYYSGKRTREWLKFKAALEQEVVIVGYTDPKKSRKYFGALLFAVREGNRWRYAGRAGTGFDEATLKSVFSALRKIPGARVIPDKVPDEAHTHWVAPKLVAETKFTEWTEGGEMRHPVFLGLRTDKKPTQVIRERGTV